MAKRRANGEGSIRKRKDGRWEGRYTAGRDPVTGKVIYKNVLGKTQAEVKEKLKAAIEKSAVRTVSMEHYTVGQWLDIWMENYAKLQVRASSYKTYQGFIDNHIKPALGDMLLKKLAAMDLQRLYKHLLESGRVECTEPRSKPKGLSVKTVRNINQMISSALNCAVEQRLIPANPTKGCVLPKLERKEMKILPPESLGTFFEEARRSGVFELYYIDLATGLRRGELLGLKWNDIDLDKGIIHVRRQVLRQNGKVVEAPLKTKNSYRNIAVGADTVKVLKGMEQKDEYVFPSPYGGPMSPDSVLHMLQRVLKRAGLERIRFHDLRHTFSVLALQNGVDVKTLPAMLGHYSAGFTLDTYAHVTTSMQKQAANAVGSFLSGTLQP
ncbi:site-specific integrase [uncultured Oscillibacter sp.]|uniref:tyrosine-type recombinase/integrase n=2 Tax=uncultured Oscillibacter sp. TaxID=876091 RepID=UPI0025F0D48B|nr:site-specific integrase [uncultured Oscillibacter sp.]